MFAMMTGFVLFACPSPFLEREEKHAEKLAAYLGRLGNAQEGLQDQFDRIKRQEHLDIAALRVEQILHLVNELDKDLAVIEKDYPQERHAKKRAAIVRLTDAKNGEIAATRQALVRLIRDLEGEMPDLESAKEAYKRLTSMTYQVRDLQTLIGPAITFERVIAMLATIESLQRRTSHLLHFRTDSVEPLIEELLKGKK